MSCRIPLFGRGWVNEKKTLEFDMFCLHKNVLKVSIGVCLLWNTGIEKEAAYVSRIKDICMKKISPQFRQEAS